MRVYAIIALAMLGYVTRLNAQVNFTPVDGNYDFKDVCAEINVTGEIFIGCDSGIILYSDDNLNTIRKSIIPGDRREVKSLAWIDQQQALYAATYDTNGIWRSMDKGITWQQLTSPATTIRSIIYSPNGLLFCTSTYNWPGDLYTSADSGWTWTQVPLNPMIDAANLSYKPGNTLMIAYGNSVNNDYYMSSDSGLTWDSLRAPFASMGITRIEQVGNSDTLIGVNGTSVWRSSDRGVTWNIIETFSSTAEKIWVSPQRICYVRSGNFIYYGDITVLSPMFYSVGTFVSTYGFMTGIQNDSILLIGNQRGAAMELYNIYPSLSAQGNVGVGLYRSLSGYDELFIHGFYNDTTIYFGMFDNNNSLRRHYQSEDNGENWELIAVNAGTACPTNMVRYADSTLVSNHKISFSTGTVFRSKDDGVTWDSCTLPVPASSLIIMPDLSMRAVYMDDVYISYDSGYSWSLLSTFPILPFVAGKLLVNESSGAIIATNTINSPKFRSTDGGLTWSSVGIPSGVRSCGYNQLTGTLFGFPDGGGMHFSYDDGATWQTDTNGLPIGPNVMTINFYATRCGNLIIQVDTGSVGLPAFYISYDDGNSWIAAGSSYHFTSLAMNQSGYLFGARDGYWPLYRSPSPFVGPAHDCQLMWPGDVNADNIVDMTDFLDLGLAFSNSGAPRSVQGIAWHPYISDDWQVNQVNGTDMKNADCDGNGSVGQSDTLAISNNYGMLHSARLGYTSSSVGAPIKMKFLGLNDSVAPGDTVTFAILIGDSMFAINTFYGLGLQLEWDANKVSSGSGIIFNQPYTGSTYLRLNESVNAGRCDLGVVRVDHADTSGWFDIGWVRFVIDTALTNADSFYFDLRRIQMIDANGNSLAVQGYSDTVYIDPALSNMGNEDLLVQPVVTPNPNDGNFNIYLPENVRGVEVEVVDLSGRIICSAMPFVSGDSRLIRYQMPLVSNGVYFVVIYGEGFVSTQKIVVNKY